MWISAVAANVCSCPPPILLDICRVVALARFDIAPCDTDCSLSQFILAYSNKLELQLS
jgi:hypothetical protein